MENQEKSTEVVEVVKKTITDRVLSKITEFQKTGLLTLPKDYSAENALKSAFLILSETKDSNKALVLQSCSEASIANTLFDMVVRCLSPLKKQYYFIAYAGKLQGQPSYFGNMATAKRVDKTVKSITANVIYEGDEFIYEVDTTTGLMKISKHETKFDNIDMDNIKGAYAIVVKEDGTSYPVIMTIKQIRRSWDMGQPKGQSPAHKGFPDEMCKRTVINRACKSIINSSDDSYLYEEQERVEIDKDNINIDIETNANTGEVISFAEEAEVINYPVTPEESFEPNLETKEEVKEATKTPKLGF